MRDLKHLEKSMPTDQEDIEDILGLTPVQEGLLFHYLENHTDNYYCGQLILDISGEIDKLYFAKAWEQVAFQNEILRTVFRWEKVKQPVQLVLKKPRVYIHYYDVSNEPGDEKKIILEMIIAKDRQQGFDLHNIPFRVTLCKIDKNNYCMIISNHHILYDGWSNGLILKEFFNTYGSLSLSRNSAVEIPFKTRLKTYLKWFQERESAEQDEAEFWTGYLKDLESRAQLVIKRNFPDKAGSFPLKLSQEEIKRIDTFLKYHQVNLAAFFYTIWGILLQEYANSNDVLIGTTVSGRSIPIKGIEHMVGLFINTLPLRVSTSIENNIDGCTESRLDLLLLTIKALQKRRAYEYTSLVKIKKYAGWHEWNLTGSLFDTIVVLENYPLELNPLLVKECSGLLINSYSIYERNHYDLTIIIKVVEGIDINFVYSEYFDEKDITTLARHFRIVMQEVISDPGAPVKTIDMISEEEKQQILYMFNNTDAEYPKEKTIHGLFEDQVEKIPDRIAFFGESVQPVGFVGHVRLVSLTYCQLNEQASRLAGLLIDKGVLPGDIIGIMRERSIEMVIDIFGILKSGGAYMPIDPKYPRERIDYMLKDSNVRILINKSEIRNSKLETNPNVQNSNDQNKNSKQLAYIIYTSGSTGRPKGVMVEHCSLVNRVIWMQKNYPLIPGDIILQKTPITFDVSVWELFWWGIAGASLCLLELGGEKDPAVIAMAVERYRVSVIHFVPSMLEMMLEYIENEKTAKQLKTLKCVFSSGEVLSSRLVVRFNRLLFECNKTQLSNLYGPTEATVDVSWYNCFGPGYTHYTRGGIIPIGRPIDNIKLYILNRYWRLVPVGLTGELCIAGVGVARGYLNKAEQTAEKFNRTYKSSILYKTGDLARWRPDPAAHGALIIDFLGRLDTQVKIRGFRIELGEIENCLLRHETVKETIVTVNEEVGGNKYLCAYIVKDKKSRFDAVQLKEYLAQSLPDYMIPARFVNLEKMPVTPHGKVDRKALPQPGIDQPTVDITYSAPESEIEKNVMELWQEVLHLDVVGVDDNFFDLGGHSLHIIRLTGRLKELFRKDVSVTTMFRYPTIRKLVHHLSDEKKLASILEQEEKLQEKMRKPGTNNIAVIGMAVRFPGARNCDEFWHNLKNGVESITFFTDEQLHESGVPADLISNPHYVKAKGILENSYHFDALFFGYSSREAQLMDPQLRLLHECAWEALEHAGWDPITFKGSIGLYIGALSNASWLAHVSGHIQDHSDWLAIGSLTDRDFFSTRLAYKLNLRGPSVTVQTACSTSLVAIQMAYRALLAGECHIALAGGVSLCHEDEYGYLYQEGMIRSHDGHCRAFDANAGGTVGGNGVGIVVLKPLAAALADNDFIHAVIKGASVNNDGAQKIGYTAPSIEGQVAVITAALREAAVEPETVTYIEAHGTGTKLGDPVEIGALTTAFNTHKKQYCAIGSVKTNIGHLDAASGVAGFVKTVLALEHRLIPPSLHFRQPNPEIDFANSPFYVNTGLKPWRNNGLPLRAGISSFGIGGANAHVILEEFNIESSLGNVSNNNFVDGFNRESARKHLLVLSARTSEELDRMTYNLAEYLKKNRHLDIRDISFTLQVGRRAFQHRRTVVVSGIDDARDLLGMSNSTDGPFMHTYVATKSSRPVVFMFPGQGAQYVNMGREIYQKEPLFREEMDHCFEILKQIMERDSKEILYPFLDNKKTKNTYKTNIIDETEIAQPVIFIIEYALARLLMSWGIQPQAMTGHSIGEYSAACIAGVFSLEDALRLVVLRGKYMQQMPAGAMLAVSLPEERINPFLDDHISLAAVNGPFSCVVTGPIVPIQRLSTNFKEAGIQNQLLHTSHAFHSAMMDPILEKFHSAIQTITFNPPRIPYISNTEGTWITPRQALDPGYWSNHLRKTIRFSDGLTEILKEEHALLIEIGPGRTLSTLAMRHPHKKNTQEVLNLLRHPGEQVSDHDFLLARIGQMWGNGLEIDWTKFNSFQARHRIPLPTYPFNSIPFQAKKIDSSQKIGSSSEGKKKDIADWFYIPIWRQSLTQLYGEELRKKKKFTWLVFMDSTGFGLRLVSLLEKEGQKVIQVEKGTGFSRKNNGIYTIDPGMGGDYVKMLEILTGIEGIEKENPISILHLWGVTPSPNNLNNIDIFQTVEAELDFGFYSLLYLAQAIGKTNLTAPLHINVITSDMQPVVGDESLQPGKAAVLGPVKIIPLEYPHIQCRSVDIRLPKPNSIEEKKLINNIAREIFSENNSAPIVAFRGFFKWEQFMEPLRFEENADPHPRLREKGVYLITGGLGGIGYTLAEYLASNIKARLILVGRSGLIPDSPWQQKVKNLEALGAEVLVFSCDVSEADEMKKVIENTTRRFGPIDGVLHAAGVADYAGIIQRRTRTMCEPILAPKIKGTLVLDTLLEGISPSFVMLFSTIGSIAWGQKFGQAAYAAANEFLDVYSFYRTAHTGQFCVSINWSDWQKVGMAVTAAEHWTKTLRLKRDSSSLLQDALLPSEGVEVFRRILAHQFPRVAVSPENLTIKIKNNTSIFKELLEIKEKSIPKVSMNGIEQTITAIWQEFLGSESIGLHDNFFDLGATSLDIIQVNNQLKSTFQKEIPLVTLYTFPTIHSLSRHLEQVCHLSTTSSDCYSNYKSGRHKNEKLKKQVLGIERSKRKLNQTIEKMKGARYGKKK